MDIFGKDRADAGGQNCENACQTLQTQDMKKIAAGISLKPYYGRIPACGVFCGGCPTYTRENRPCQGADLNRSRCERCKTFHLCCLNKGITHCFQCTDFPCTKFKGFAKRWLRYGQNFIENQKLLKQVGEDEFLKYYNKKMNHGYTTAK